MDFGEYYDLMPSNFGQYELARFGQTLPHLLTDGTLLDVGCGNGNWLTYVAERARDLKLSGVDISPKRISTARKRLSKDVGLEVADIRALPFSNEQFNQVTALEVLEHLPDWKKGLSELTRVSSHRVIATVPYGKQLKYEVCWKCGSKAYLEGHLHSLTEDNFSTFQCNGQLSYELLPQPVGIGYYFNRFLRGSKLHDDGEHDLVAVCPNCYAENPYSTRTRMKKIFERIVCVVTNKPEHLLIQIDK
ncbi:MAG: class I SAM-dependent methyltransferase [Candidatus Aenigmatarchaeota archaeon]